MTGQPGVEDRRKVRVRSAVSDPQRWAPCVRCGGCYQRASRWPEGRICMYCCAIARQREGRCAVCGHRGVLPGISSTGEPTCVTCSGVPVDVHCRRCGAEAPMGRGHTCWRCRLTDAVTETLTNSDGTVPAHLQPLAVALTSMPRANSGYVWIRSPRVQTLLRALAANQVALTHSALDELPHSRTVEYLRGLLITHGLLPTRDYHLAAFERWLAAKLEQLTNTDHHQLIYRYARWHLLPRLRQQARTGPVSASAFLTTKQSTTAAIRFLAWLDAHGTALHDATQHHLDRWFAEGPTTRLNADRFVRWAIKHRLLRHLRATKSTGRSSPVLSEQQRREHLRRVLLDDTVTISHRVIAVLVLLFGQPISRIVQLHTDDVIIDGDRTLLRLAHDPLEVPQPAATLLRNYLADPRYRRNTAAQPDTPWLFPGVMPGRPIHIHRAAKALRDLGIPPGAARAGTWLHLVRQAPPPVLAEALGISPETAMRHASRAGADYLGYPTRTQAPSATTS